MNDTTGIWKTRDNRTIVLGEKIGEGGEGSVWTIAGRPDVAKIYLPQVATPDREKKLAVMLANPPRDDMRLRFNHVSIAWPTELLYQASHFSGYLMPRLSESFKILDIYNPRIRRSKCPGFNWKYQVHTALNLAIAMDAVHSGHYVIGDINEGNILVNSRALVSLIDTDSFQVSDQAGQVFRCPVGKEEFTPPELQGIEFNRIDRLPRHDYFGLAVLVFLLLMEGNYPFSGKMKTENPTADPDNIYCLKSGAFPYASNSLCGPRPLAPKFEILPPELRRLMLRTFVEGYSHPAVRPAPAEWIQVLEKTEASLQNCRKDASHWYSRHLRQCPWCAKEAPRLQVPLPPIQQGVHAQPTVQAVPSAVAAAVLAGSQGAGHKTPALPAKFALPGLFKPPVRPQSTPTPVRKTSQSNTSVKDYRQKLKKWFRPSGYRPRITRQFWWRNVRLSTLMGTIYGVGLAALVTVVFSRPVQAGIVLSAVMSLAILSPGGWFLYKEPDILKKQSLAMRVAVKTIVVGLLAVLAVLCWQSFLAPITAFLSQFQPQMGWLFLDGVLAGSGLGSAYGTFRLLARYKNVPLAFILSTCLAALPFIILVSVGAINYSFTLS